MGMMPLCLFIYTKMWTDSNAIVLPYDSIGESIFPSVYPPLSHNHLYTIILQSGRISSDF